MSNAGRGTTQGSGTVHREGAGRRAVIEMSRWRFVAALLVVAVVTGFVTAFAVLSPPSSPLAAGLEGLDRDAAERVFAARIARRFPPGTPIPEMVAALKGEGFEPGWFNAVDADNYLASRGQGGFPCAVEALVIWSPDRTRKRVAAIRGYWSETCL